MISKEKYQDKLINFKAMHGLDATKESLAMVYHLARAHSMDHNRAIDQSSTCGGDFGIDGWCYDTSAGVLYIYQSKLSERRTTALSGLSDLIDKAAPWLEQALSTELLAQGPTHNHCLYNLFKEIPEIKKTLQKISFRLVSLFERDEFSGAAELDQIKRAESTLARSPLNKYLKGQNIQLGFDLVQYTLSSDRVAEDVKQYPIARFSDSKVTYLEGSLSLAYLPLFELVNLYRVKSINLFNKNVRMPVAGLNSKNRKRLYHPVMETLERICEGKLSPEIFPFYHVGITLSAAFCEVDKEGKMLLEQPSVINGCQTTTIAHEYLELLERKNMTAQIERFKQIKVVAKVVIGLAESDLKEVTNSNNRQAPIDAWQLFSNDPIHIRIENSLEKIGIFYERQDGKFKAVMKSARDSNTYYNTGAACVTVKDLGQIAALFKRDFSLAGHPAKIFEDKATHDSIFDDDLLLSPEDIVFLFNSKKAARNGFNHFLDKYDRYHKDPRLKKIFGNPNVKMLIQFLGLLSVFQKKNYAEYREQYGMRLNRFASSSYSKVFEDIYEKFVSRVVSWFLDESNQLKADVTKSKYDRFVNEMCDYLGLSLSQNYPFRTKKRLDRAA